jgi:hypothetical protein
VSALVDELSPNDELRLMGEAQMLRFKNPHWPCEQVAKVMGLPPGLVRLWAFRDRLTPAETKGLSQYRYPDHDEDDAT